MAQTQRPLLAATPCSHPEGPDRRAPSARRSFFFPLLAGVVLAACCLAACSTTPPENTANACAIFAEKRGWWDAVRDAERRWGLPPHITLAIIEQESAFESEARPPRGRFLFVFPGRRPSSAFGYAQAVDSTWETYKKDTGRRFASREDFRDAADFVAWYGARSQRLSGISLTDARNQYLAYHEGHGGYNRRTYRSKGWLMDRAGDVARQAATYDRQLDTCRRSLNRRFLFF